MNFKKNKLIVGFLIFILVISVVGIYVPLLFPGDLKKAEDNIPPESSGKVEGYENFVNDVRVKDDKSGSVSSSISSSDRQTTSPVKPPSFPSSLDSSSFQTDKDLINSIQKALTEPK